MIAYTTQEQDAIRAWLRGDRNYYVNRRLKYLSTNRYGDMSQSWLNDTYDPQGAFDYCKNREGLIDWKVAQVDQVRYDISALKSDMTYRAPSLSFIWFNFAQIERDEINFNRRLLRFFIEVELVNEEQSISIVLFRTGLYKIVSAAYLHSTASAQGSDAQITSIPWAFEYNHTFKWGPKQYDILGGTVKPDFLGDEFWDTVGALLYQSKALHDRYRSEKKESGNYGYIPDAPCPSSGPFIRSVRNPIITDSDITMLDFKIEDDNCIQKALDFNGSVGKSFAFGIYTPLLLTDNIESNLLSILSWKAFMFGVALVPDVYKDKEPFDVPILTFDSPRSDDVFSQYEIGRRYLMDLNDFNVIEDSDDAGLSSVDYVYEIAYEQLNPTEASISGMVEVFRREGLNLPWVVDFEFSDWSSGSDVEDLFGAVNKPYSGLELGSLYNSDGGYINFLGADSSLISVNATVGGYRKYPISMTAVLGKGLNKVSIDLHGAYRIDKITHKESAGVTFVPNLDRLNFPTLQMSRLFGPYTERKKFRAEWRPWLSLYDMITVSDYDNFGLIETFIGYITAIDMDMDSLSAQYEIVVIDKVKDLQESVSITTSTHAISGEYYGRAVISLPENATLISLQMIDDGGVSHYDLTASGTVATSFTVIAYGDKDATYDLVVQARYF